MLDYKNLALILSPKLVNERLRRNKSKRKIPTLYFFCQKAYNLYKSGGYRSRTDDLLRARQAL